MGNDLMCGRLTQRATAAELQVFFDLFRMPQISPRYNIAPTQPLLTIRADGNGHRFGDFQQWGLIPLWSDNAAVGSKLINWRRSPPRRSRRSAGRSGRNAA